MEGNKYHYSVKCGHSEKGVFLPSDVIRKVYINVKLTIKDKKQFTYEGMK